MTEPLQIPLPASLPVLLLELFVLLELCRASARSHCGLA